MDPSIALVTGASSGIGQAVAQALASKVAILILAVRSAEQAAAAVESVRTFGAATVTTVVVDLASQSAIHRAATLLRGRFGRLDILVNSAGHTYFERERTGDGLEASFAMNVLGPFLLTNLLHPMLTRASHARIVDLAGIYQRNGEIDLDDLGFERRGFDVWKVSQTTQQARVMLAQERARRLPGSVTVNAVHPGAVLTNAQKGLPWHVRLLIHTVLRPGFVNPARGAAPVVRLAIDPEVAGITGRFFNRYRETDVDYPPEHTSALWNRCAELVAGSARPDEGAATMGLPG